MAGNKKKLKLNRESLSIVKRLWRESVRQYKYLIFLALFFMVVGAAGDALMVKLLQPMVDRVFIDQDRSMLWPVAISAIFLFVVKGLSSYGESTLMNMIGLQVINDTQNKLFRHISRLDHSFFNNNSTGSLMSRFMVDATIMRNVVSNTIVGLGRDLLTVLFLVALMFTQDTLLASIVFFVFPIAIYPIVYTGRKIRKVTTNMQEEMGVLNTALEQTFQGISVVKTYGMEWYEEKTLAAKLRRIFDLQYKSARTKALNKPIMEFLGAIAIAIVIVYGGSRVMSGETTAGTFFSFIAALLAAYQPMRSISSLNSTLQEGLSGAQRLFEIMDVEPAIVDRPFAKELDFSRGHVSLKDVSFSYNPDKPVLKNISMDVQEGHVVALVGASGAGKTTVLSLLPRFYDVMGGSVSIDGQDIRDVTLASLRSKIALVSQDVLLFDDTIYNNILYGRFDATQDEVFEAAKNAAAHDFILAAPGGYQAMVGERGTKLSGGQRQRLAIARAMLKNAPILLLDEATSALDTKSERLVQSALERLMQGRTTLVVAHRLSTIVNADLIYVFDKGGIIEEGTHEELIEKSGAYRKLYEMQFSKEGKSSE